MGTAFFLNHGIIAYTEVDFHRIYELHDILTTNC